MNEIGFWPEITGPHVTTDWTSYDWEEAWRTDESIEGAEVLHAYASSPDGYGSLEFAFVLRLVDGRHATCCGWADTTGWGCRDDAEVKVFDTYDDAVRWGLTDEHRREFGMEQPDGR